MYIWSPQIQQAICFGPIKDLELDFENTNFSAGYFRVGGKDEPFEPWRNYTTNHWRDQVEFSVEKKISHLRSGEIPLRIID